MAIFYISLMAQSDHSANNRNKNTGKEFNNGGGHRKNPPPINLTTEILEQLEIASHPFDTNCHFLGNIIYIVNINISPLGFICCFNPGTCLGFKIK
jgi:hypothetical protein